MRVRLIRMQAAEINRIARLRVIGVPAGPTLRRSGPHAHAARDSGREIENFVIDVRPRQVGGQPFFLRNSTRDNEETSGWLRAHGESALRVRPRRSRQRGRKPVRRPAATRDQCSTVSRWRTISFGLATGSAVANRCPKKAQANRQRWASIRQPAASWRV
jgi:hypothetical protein